MYISRIKGLEFCVPDNVVTNNDLSKLTGTSDGWTQEYTGIRKRRHVLKGTDTITSMGVKASLKALEAAQVNKDEINFVIFATPSPDYYFPGCGVLVQKELGLKTVGALDIRNQYSGFIYVLSIADQFIKTGMYKNILVIGTETRSPALDMSTRGRNMAVFFGGGAGAAVVSRSDDPAHGILSMRLHSQGEHATELVMVTPGVSARWTPQVLAENDPDDVSYYLYINGRFVFKNAVVRFAEVVEEGLKANGLTREDISILIPHQTNYRISQFVQHQFKLSDEQIFDNIMKYDDTTAASVPITLTEAVQQGRVRESDLVVLAAFGSGFTWGNVITRW